MIRLQDATTLAFTKLRTRKLRTIITVVTSGILFSLLITILMVFNGIERSVNSFSTEGLSKRFIASVSSFSNYGYDNSVYANKDIIARAEQIYKDRIELKKKEAKRLEIDYDPNSEPKPTEKDGDSVRLIDYTYASTQALEEYSAAHPKTQAITTIKKLLAPYHPKAYYSSDMGKPISGELNTMQGGKEIFVKNDKNKQSQYPGSNQIFEPADPAKDGMTLMDGKLTDSFISRQSKWKASEGTIPIIITYASAENFLGYKKLAANATSKDKLTRIGDVRNNASGIRFDVCYRNNTSKSLIDNSVATTKEIAKNKGKTDYQKPTLIYGLPSSDSCGVVPVVADTRTAEIKIYEANQKIFDKEFGKEVDPVQTKLKFRVVGVSPGMTYGTAGTVTDIMSSLLNSSLGSAWVIPTNLYDKLPVSLQYRSILDPTSQMSSDQIEMSHTRQYNVEFSNPTDARSALKKYSCALFGCDYKNSIGMVPFGSGSIAIAELKDSARNTFFMATLVIAAVATLIMAGTVGRMIADGRRETAVFRAIGANRSDISLIYLVYTLLLTTCVASFGLVLGAVLSLVLDFNYSSEATVSAQLLFGSTDLSRQFHLFGFASVELLYVICLMYVTGLISTLFPLLRNVRRNPIKDMRDE